MEDPTKKSYKFQLEIQIEKLQDDYDYFLDLSVYQEVNYLCRQAIEAEPDNENYKIYLIQSYQELSEKYECLGNFELSRSLLEKAYYLIKSYANANPDSRKMKIFLVWFKREFATKYVERDLIPQAVKTYLECIPLCEELCKIDKFDADYQDYLLGSYQQLSILYGRLKDGKNSRIYAEKYYELSQELFDKTPKNFVVITHLLIANSMIGMFYFLEGNHEKSLKFRETTQSMIKKQIMINSEISPFKTLLAFSNVELGQAHIKLENYEEALAYFNDFESLIDKYPIDYQELGEWERDVVMGLHNQLGLAYKTLKDEGLETESEMIKHFQLYHEHWEERYESNPEDETAINIFIDSNKRLGDIWVNKNDADKALDYYKVFNQIAKKEYEYNPDKKSIVQNLIDSYVYLGEIYSYLDMNVAVEYYQALIDLLKEKLDQNPNNYFIKVELAKAYVLMTDLYKYVEDEEKDIGKDAEIDEDVGEYFSEDDIGGEFGEWERLGAFLRDHQYGGIFLKYKNETIDGEVKELIGVRKDEMSFLMKAYQLHKELCAAADFENDCEDDFDDALFWQKTDFLTVYDRIVEIYHHFNNQEEVIRFCHEKIILITWVNENHFNLSGGENNLACNHLRIGEAYHNQGRQDLALQYFESAKKDAVEKLQGPDKWGLSKSLDRVNIVKANARIGIHYMEEKNHELAKTHLKSAKKECYKFIAADLADSNDDSYDLDDSVNSYGEELLNTINEYLEKVNGFISEQ